MIPFRTAHRAEQHGVGLFAGVNGVLRQGTAVSIYGDAARRLFRKIENVPVFFADGVQNVYRLADNVRPYPYFLFFALMYGISPPALMIFCMNSGYGSP